MRANGGLGRPERDLRAAAILPSAPIGLDVPIETKLHAPGPRKEWVQRPALIHYLTGADAKLILVDAPAGFGKTTLVSQWRASEIETRPFAWLSLDQGDDDPGRLWWYVVCALQRACPGLAGYDILRALRVQAPDIAGEVLPALVNELAALPTPVVLVLDDYHVIKERRCHGQVASLLTHLPPSAQVVLITRADPPLPLARLRAVGELAEFRAHELRFAPGDAATLVRNISAVELSEPDLADLVERAEGWPAGVYLAALSLRGHPSPSAFVRQFTGDNRFIVDFLAEEVLSRQPSEILQFLARTSILARFCAPLCDAVVGSANATEIIEVLERENLFVVPLDENREWFRYHHLFAQMLRSELARAEPDIVPTLHERASAWHRQSGSADEAIGHALAAGDVTGTIDLIARHWYAYTGVGRAGTVCGWMRSLGDDQIHEGPLPDGMRSLRSSAALLRGVYGFDGLRVMRESAADAAELESDPRSPWYAMARGALGFSLYLSGEPKAAAEPLEEALQNQASTPLARMLTLSVLSLVAIELGRLPRALELASAARSLGRRDDLSQAPQSSVAYIAMGAVYAAQGRLDQARSELDLAVRSRRGAFGVSPWPTLEATLLLARVLIDLGDRVGAAELADEARDLLTALPDGAEAQLARLERLELRLTDRPRWVSLAEPLTEREAAVLRLLRGTLSLREIGQQLCLSQNTIKTHAQAIYRKLGVSTRQDAVLKGHEIDIL